MGASPQQTLDVLLEAEAYDGPSLVIAYSHCIAHGIDMRLGLHQQKLAADSGHWPLYRFRPASDGRSPGEFLLESPPPSIPLRTYAYNEIRYRMLSYTDPDGARRLLEQAQEDVAQRWEVYRALGDRYPAATVRGRGTPGSHVEPSARPASAEAHP
jgi:pyruvate-ferredoxin/flavodoxin oxidoreductase